MARAVTKCLESGDEFNQWTLLVPVEGRRKKWLCVCACGTDGEALESNLVRGRSMSCGCSRKGKACPTKSHGMSKTRLYRVWTGMKSRCQDVGSRDYPYWGGRGITVCRRWSVSFEAFRDDVGDPPGPGYSLDRRDNNRGYEPGNVRWATRLQQQQNRRMCTTIAFAGKSQCISAWARETGVSKHTIRKRLVEGWPVEEIFGPPRNRGRARVQPC